MARELLSAILRHQGSEKPDAGLRKMKPLTSRDSIPDSESDFPPVLLCARCGSSSCSGCEVGSGIVQARSEIAFEDGMSVRSFWTTVIACSVEPNVFFGRRLRGAGIVRALAFAIVCEWIALGSVFLVLGLVLVALLPGTLTVLMSPTVVLAAALLWIGSITFMVLVHALGGLTFLFGAGARPPGSLPLVLRFGFYSCGWDLVTSPAGVLLLALFGKSPARFEPLWRAAGAPRPAMNAILGDGFGLNAEDQKIVLRRITRTALAWFGATIGVVGIAAYLWLTHTGILAYVY